MSDILRQINKLDHEIATLRARYRLRKFGERERVRELEAAVKKLWHQRRVELAGLDMHLYDYEDIMRRPHMIDLQHVPGAGEWRVYDDEGDWQPAEAAVAERAAEMMDAKAARWQRGAVTLTLEGEMLRQKAAAWRGDKRVLAS